MQDNWQNFLVQQTADIENEFGSVIDHASDIDTFTDLSQFHVLAIAGEDSGDFLHGQFASDVSALAVNEVQQSSWCNIKGRVIASFLLYRSHDCFYLVLERELTDIVIKRLRMFVLRSRVSIDDKSEDLIRIGIRGEDTHNHLNQFLESIPETSTISLLSMKDNPVRSLILCPLEQAESLWQHLAEKSIAVGRKLWAMYDIRAGIAWIGKSGSEEFLPQSLNMDLTGGLSFDKGCYPGQEIIARMHFRGKLKQRLFFAQVSINEAPAAKTKLFVAELTQHIGMVVNSIMLENNKCLMLAVLDLEIDRSDIHLNSVDGPKIEVLTLPYSQDI
jgi:tRNA-modifying protein YgfZ